MLESKIAKLKMLIKLLDLANTNTLDNNNTLGCVEYSDFWLFFII